MNRLLKNTLFSIGVSVVFVSLLLSILFFTQEQRHPYRPSPYDSGRPNPGSSQASGIPALTGYAAAEDAVADNLSEDDESFDSVLNNSDGSLNTQNKSDAEVADTMGTADIMGAGADPVQSSQETAVRAGASEEDAYNALLSAEQDIREMETSGLGVQYVKDVYAEAKDSFESRNITLYMARALALNSTDPQLGSSIYSLLQETVKNKGGGNFTLVVEKAGVISQRKEQAYEILDMLDSLQFDLQDFTKLNPQANTSMLYLKFEMAKQEFADERYSSAEQLINETYSGIDELIVESSRMNVLLRSSERGIKNFVMRHKAGVAVSIAVFAVLILIAVNEFLIMSYRRKKRSLRIEDDVLVILIKKVQRDYYQYKTLAKNLFNIKIKKYRERSLRIKETMPVVEHNLRSRIRKRRFYLPFLFLKKKAD